MLSFLSSSEADLEHSIHQFSTKTVVVAVVLMLILVPLSIWAVRTGKNKLKAPLFWLMVAIVAITTFTLTAGTIYLNVRSETGGPVHWHADIEFWACGNELNLRDPQGLLSNKIGTSTYHEHNDKRIHLEGVPVQLPYDASLGKFMDVVGGSVTRNSLVVPLNDHDYFENQEGRMDGDGPGAPNPELVEPFIHSGRDGTEAVFINGQRCGDQPSEVQVFTFQIDELTQSYTQTKLDDPANYAISRHSDVPPGDCIIFEFGPPRDRTDKLCEQYGVRDTIRCGEFGVEPDKRGICELEEVTE
jgi:hypothetical protein